MYSIEGLYESRNRNEPWAQMIINFDIQLIPTTNYDKINLFISVARLQLKRTSVRGHGTVISQCKNGIGYVTTHES